MFSFKDKISNIIENKKSVSLRFLSLTEQSTVINSTKHTQIAKLDGGYDGAELKRAYFYTNQDLITCFKIDYSTSKLTLTHQNILGTLLSIGVTRDSVGDILPKQGVFFVTKEIEKEIIESFTMINHVPIRLFEYDRANVYSETMFLNDHFTIDSMRLDNVVNKIIKKGRSEAQLMIEKDLVKLNHIIATKTTIKIKENDVISIRKFGRYKIIDCKNTSKKGKIIVNYAKYI